MKFLLDSNACIQHLRGRAPAAMETRFRSAGDASLALCSVVRAELVYGALRAANPAAAQSALAVFLSRFPSLPFNDQAADHAARLRAHLAASGNLIGPADLQIAAIALANKLTLVTHNTAEFNRVPGLRVEDWQ